MMMLYDIRTSKESGGVPKFGICRSCIETNGYRVMGVSGHETACDECGQRVRTYEPYDSAKATDPFLGYPHDPK